MTIAVIGYGYMGKAHARVLRKLGHQVLTVDPAGHADYPSIPKLGFAEGAVIATPPEQILSVVLACESFGVPILLIEKPLAPTLAEAATIAVRHPRTWVGYVERFNPILPVVEAALPALGEIKRITVKRLGLEARNDLGPYRDLATHDIDLLESLTLPLERTELRVGYGTTKERTWLILGENGYLRADWQAQTVNGTHFTKQEPLAAQWTSLLAGDPAPVDTRGAVQILRLAIQHERDHEPVAA